MGNRNLHLSIVTPTWNRHKHLVSVLDQVARQSLGHLQVEHLVVSDGPDPVARAIVKQSQSKYLELKEHFGVFGVVCKDYAIANAQGEYVCFWDDDNLYLEHAAAVQYAAARGHQIGIVQADHWSVTHQKFRQIPGRWTGKVQPGHIDTMCLCVKCELAQLVQWAEPPHESGSDHRWLSKLCQQTDSINFVPIVVGKHLVF